MPALRCLFRAQNGFKLFALFSLESLDSSRSPSPYQPESVTANNSNKLQTWQDHDVRNLINNLNTGEIYDKMEQLFPVEKFPEIHTKISGFFFLMESAPGLPFEQFHFFRKFSSRVNRKNVFHLPLNRNFRNFRPNGKRPWTRRFQEYWARK